MDKQQRGNEVFSEKLRMISEKLSEIVAAESQTDTEIHMVSDSMDVISDTSDTIFGITEFMKEKSSELKEISDYHKEEAESAVNTICDLLEECADIESSVKDEEVKGRIGSLITHLENLAEQLSEKVVTGYEDFITVAEGYDHDIEMIDHSICDFLDMSHDIQNVVRVLADSVNEITEASEDVSKEFQELLQEMYEK